MAPAVIPASVPVDPGRVPVGNQATGTQTGTLTGTGNRMVGAVPERKDGPMTRLPDVQARRVAVPPFSTLDADWASLCRRHWRSGAIAHWVRQEPVLAGCRRLADVIPPPGVDRTPVCRALARLSIAGDELATRALLQLLVPGLVRLAARWRTVFGSLTEAGGEVVSRAALYIERLKEIDTTCNPAGYVLYSVNRDLIDAGRSAAVRYEVPVLDPDERAPRGGGHTAPTAENAAFAGPLVWTALVEGVRRGVLPELAARVVWLHAAGHAIPALARDAGVSVPQAYRLRDHGYAHLRDQLAEAC